jgi:hypothetical protein
MTSSTAPTVKPPASGRATALAALAMPLVGLVVYGVSLLALKQYTTPWYLPLLATLGVYLAVVAVVRARTVFRFVALGLTLLVAAASWHMLVFYSRLPAYAGPVAVGKEFPAFAAVRADGSPFTRDDLRGDKDTLFVFFRGRW